MIYLFGEKLKQNKGSRSRVKAAFTLLEMLTSISLIVIITALFIANYKSSNKRTDLTMTAQKLVTDIHAAQNNTLGLVKYGNEVPAGGWGIHFDMANPSQYILFADLNQPGSTEIGQEQTPDWGFMRYDEGEGDQNLGARVVDLPVGIEITSLAVASGGEKNMVNVSFLPPDPRTYIFDGTASSTALAITLKEEREGTTKTVRVNFLGLAEVIN